MKAKTKVVLYMIEVIIILVVVSYLAITKEMPKYQQSLGSSERLFQSTNYKTGVEVNIPTGPAFFLVINENNQITNIFIENEKAFVLANKDIEGKKLQQAIPEICQKLMDANLIESQVINVINYKNEEIMRQVVSLIKTTLETNQKKVQIIEQKATLQDKGKALNIETKEDTEILWSLYLTSTDLIDKLKKQTTTTTSPITKELASTYADSIYQKLITYMINANVQNQERNDMSMPIQYIPGDTNNTVYPTSDSWYYITNFQVYAEITIKGKQEYTFCYQGSSTNKKEGICS